MWCIEHMGQQKDEFSGDVLRACMQKILEGSLDLTGTWEDHTETYCSQAVCFSVMFSSAKPPSIFRKFNGSS